MNMRNLEDPPEPYRIQFSPNARPETATFSGPARERLNRKLLQLADLAAFAAGYSISVSQTESLVADTGGVSIEYRVDDSARVLTVLKIAAEPKGE